MNDEIEAFQKLILMLLSIEWEKFKHFSNDHPVTIEFHSDSNKIV